MLTRFALLFAVASGCGGPTVDFEIIPASTIVEQGGSRQLRAVDRAGQPVSVTWKIDAPAQIDDMGVVTLPEPVFVPLGVKATRQDEPDEIASAVLTVYDFDHEKSLPRPILLGCSGGQSDFVKSVNETSSSAGTLGSLVTRDDELFILSNNHVLADEDASPLGTPIQQPGSLDCQCNGAAVGSLAQFVPIAQVDAALAAIVAGTVDPSGSIMALGAPGTTAIAAAPPSQTIASAEDVMNAGEGVAKSGRTTGLTCSTILSVHTTVMDSENFTTYADQIIIDEGGATFVTGGDSGSLVVTSDTARPVALLYAANSMGIVATPIDTVLSALASSTGSFPTIVGGEDHVVSCNGNVAPIPTRAQHSIALRLRDVHARYVNEWMRSASTYGVGIGPADDDHPEGTLVFYVLPGAGGAIPAMVEGVPTRIVEGEPFRRL